MKRKKLILFGILLGVFLISFSSASSLYFGDFSLPQKQGECFNIFEPCDNCSYMNITILFPNGTPIIENQAMTNLSSTYYYNYTFCNTSVLGIYPLIINYDEDGRYLYSDTDFFEVTQTGRDFDAGQTLGALALLGGVLATAFMFIFVGSKLSENDKTLPVGFFFSVMAIFLVISSLHLSWILSVDILQHEIISEGISTIFIVVLWSCTGIAIIFFALMFIAFIKELGKTIKKKKFGEDFNPITNTYD